MEWIRQLQDAVDYMEAHLLENVNYEDAARSVFLSAYSFHRSFSMLAGLTPAEYIRRRRLSLAGCELQDTDITVLDAALKYGYDSPVSFARAFRAFHGINPNNAGKRDAAIKVFRRLLFKCQTVEEMGMLGQEIVCINEKEYKAKFGDEPTCSVIKPSEGAHLV